MIDVLLNHTCTPIDEAVFVALLENSVASTYVDYERALRTSEISFNDLVRLARHGEIPYTLFFAPLSAVEAQIMTKTDKLLNGLNKDTFSVNSRDKVSLRDIELIVKDLLRKQELLKMHDTTLTKNRIVGLLAKSGESVAADAATLMGALGLTHESIRSARNKSVALTHLIACLESNQVLVSQSVQHFMPQRLTGVKFSGMTIKDAKVPYIFLAGGDPGDYQEPDGRRIFTLTLMSVLIARKIFAPVTYDGSSIGSTVKHEYDVVGEMLMPASALWDVSLASLEEIKAAADVFKVTPSAMTVRAMRLERLGAGTAVAHLEKLKGEYEHRQKSQARTPSPVNGVRKYAGRELVTRMLHALDDKRISPRDFCRAVCLNRIGPSQINDLRSALR
ncbi:hypothetical protein [Myceligenerans crystallogenes]|uniref:Uncharacterized protein n=1 Tax=Myceligenerans crystallogenes TaxID=316335 RepID=A0ABN2NH23_9MICO